MLSFHKRFTCIFKCVCVHILVPPLGAEIATTAADTADSNQKKETAQRDHDDNRHCIHCTESRKIEERKKEKECVQSINLSAMILTAAGGHIELQVFTFYIVNRDS